MNRVSNSMKALTSYNIIFTHRDIRPSVRPELEADSGGDSSSEEVDSAGHTRTT